MSSQLADFEALVDWLAEAAGVWFLADADDEIRLFEDALGDYGVAFATRAQAERWLEGCDEDLRVVTTDVEEFFRGFLQDTLDSDAGLELHAPGGPLRAASDSLAALRHEVHGRGAGFWVPAQKERAALSVREPGLRYEYLVKRVVDREVAWGLWDDGWALLGDPAGGQFFPIWPAYAYASAFAAGSWAGYEPRSIGLEDLIDVLLERLGRDGHGVAPFPVDGTASNVTINVDEFRHALLAECDLDA